MMNGTEITFKIPIKMKRRFNLLRSLSSLQNDGSCCTHALLNQGLAVSFFQENTIDFAAPVK